MALQVNAKRWVEPLIMIIAVAIPLIPSAWLHFNFAYDWPVHLYHLAYFGEYFRHFHSFPSVMNTDSLVGWVLPVFYGSTFYSVAGILASVIGAAFAYRIFIAAGLLLQYFLVRESARDFGADKFTSNAFAVIMTWAIYPMTNLYNRSAATEFAAVLALNCAVCSWLLISRDETRSRNVLYPWLFGFLLALCLGSHPITAVYGLAAFLPYWVVTVLLSNQKKRLLLITALCALGVTLVVAPWAYATYLFRPHLQISFIVQKIWFSPAIDWFWTRFSPFPYDPRPPDDSTPHLDAQMAAPYLYLCLLVLAGYFRRQSPLVKAGTRDKFFVWFSLALFGVFFVLSNLESVWNHIPIKFHIVQMAYRLVSYLNLTLLLAALGSVSLLKFLKPAWKKALRFAIVFFLVLSFAAAAVKIRRALNVNPWPGFAGLNSREPDKLLADIPFGVQNMARNMYATPFLFPHGPQNEKYFYRNFFADREKFGKTLPMGIAVPEETWLLTNVQTFPWNKIYVDGVLTPQVSIRDYLDNLAVQLKPGKHLLTYSFEPDATWSALKVLSDALTIAWFFFIVIASVFIRFFGIGVKNSKA